MPPRQEASAGVASLVSSIKQHQKFRQLASYSVQCLCRAVTPPTVGWERNLKEAFEAGALEAISEVLKRHKGDETVLAASTQCFSSMATNPKYAAALVESGALTGMLESVASNPEAKEGVKETLQLLETVASTNPEALLKHGGAEAAVKLLQSGSSNPSIMAASVRTLEKLNKVPGAGAKMIETGAVKMVMNLTTMPVKDEATGEVVESSMRMLERMCRMDENAEYIRDKLDGMQVLSNALEVHKSNDKVCKAGGRVLTKLASGNVEELISRMEKSTVATEKEFLSGLLANLALEEENAEKIVSKGGVKALLKTFESSSKKTIESSARAIARLAQTEDNIEELVANGALDTLIGALQTSIDDESIVTSVTPTLAKFAVSQELGEKLLATGGVEAVLAALSKHPEFEANAANALSFLENLGTSDFDLSKLTALGAIPAIGAAMKKHGKNEALQLAGTRTLIYLSFNEANVNAMVTAGVLAPVLNNLDLSRSKDLVCTALYLATSIALVPANKEALVKFGGVEKILAAVAQYSNEDSVKETADELLSNVIGVDQVKVAIESLGLQVDAALKSKSKTDMAKLKEMTNRLAALSATQEFAEFVIKADGVKTIVKALDAVSSKYTTLPDAESVLVACGNALVTIGGAVEGNQALSASLMASGAAKAMINSVKAAPKLIKHVTTAVRFLEKHASDNSSIELLVEEGAIDACVAALRANGNNADVCGSALSTMLTIAASDKGALSLAKYGGTRQLIATVQANTGTPGFQKPMEKALSVLLRVSQVPEGAEALIKQGGVDAVISCTTVLTTVKKNVAVPAGGAAGGDAAASSEDVASSSSGGATSTASSLAAQAAVASAKALARLLTADDVEIACEEITELGRACSKTNKLPKLDALLPIANKLSYMTTVGNFADLIVRLDGHKPVATVLGIIMSKCDDSKPDDLELKHTALPPLLTAIANISKTNPLDPALGLAPLISKALESQVAVAECLECIKNIAKNDKASAEALVKDGKTLEIVTAALKANQRDPAIATACFGALAALASHDTTANLVASSSALALVSTWIDDNLDDASRESIQAALNALSNMALSGPHAAAMLDGGAVELVKAVLMKVCIEGETPSPTVLASCVNMLRRLGNTSETAGRITASGALRRVVRAVASHPEYLKDGDCAESIIELVRANADNEAVAGELAAVGAQELIVAAMNANGTSERVVKAGAVALTALGAGEEAGRICLEEVRQLSEALEAAGEVTEEGIAALGAAVQRLGNFMLIDGVVTPANAPAMLTVVANAVALMAESELAPPEILASAMQSIGRLVDLGGEATASAADEAVHMVMDVLSLNPDNAIIKEAAVHTLGTLSTTPIGLRAIHETNAIAVITEAARTGEAGSRLQIVVDNTIARMTESATRNAAQVLAEGGSGALTAVVQAAEIDPLQLQTVLCNIAGIEGGDDALFDIVATPSASSDLMNETLRVLRERQEGMGQVANLPGTARRVQGLAKSLQAALTAQSANTTADARSKLAALRMAENTLSLLAMMEMDEAGAETFFKAEGLTALMQLASANADDEDTVKKITHIMRSAMTHATVDAAQFLSHNENMETVVGLLKAYKDSESIAADLIEVMASTVKFTGAEKSGIDTDGMRLLQETAAGQMANTRLQSAFTSLQSTLQSKFFETEAAQRLMQQTLRAATTALSTAGTIQELQSEDGKLYYHDSATNTTSWEAPANYLSMRTAMLAVAEAAQKQKEEYVADVDAATITSMIAALSNHAKDQTIINAASTVLSALAANARNADLIASSGGIPAAIAAMQVNPDNVALLRVLLILMERISRTDAHKEQIISAGGLDVILDIAIARHVKNEEIALKSMSIIANLAFNSDVNIGIIMERDGVKAVEAVLQAHRMAPRVLENAMCVLSNLMYGSDENKLTIGQMCGDEVTGVIRDHAAKDVNLFKMALRALGNLSYCDENIRFVVEDNTATKWIVAGMRANAKDEDALQVSMEVIGNFASLEEEEPEVDEDGNIIDEKTSISMLILRDAGCAEILGTMKRFPHNSSILKAGMDALSNIANDVEVTEKMVAKQGLLQTVIEIMQTNDWDEEIIRHAVALLATITFCRDCLATMAGLDVIQLLLTSMEQHGSNPEVLQSAQLALTNLSSDETCRTTLRNMEGVRTMLAIFEHNMGVKVFVEEVFKTLTRLCSDDELSSIIAQNGMHIIMAAIDKYARDPEFLTTAFRLMGHLAFVESNLTVIVQHNGIQKVITAITEHPDYQPLMVRAIQTLDNIAMANKENAAIVIDEGGKELIEMIMSQDQYKEDGDVQKYGKSALLSMSALENLSKSAEITAKAAKASAMKKATASVEVARPVDPIADIRHKLSAGKIMKVWTKGSPASAHVLVSPDFKSIVWQDVKSQKKLGALDLRQISAIKGGHGEGHKKALLGPKQAEPELCLTINGDRTSLDLECVNAKEAKEWTEAFNKLWLTFRQTPQLL